jgi:hypothetical protein
MNLKIRVSAEKKEADNSTSSIPFVYEYNQHSNPQFTLYCCDITYTNLKAVATGNSFDSFTFLLDKLGLENIELLFKDREHLEKFRWVQKSNSSIEFISDAKEQEEVLEGLENLKKIINN